MRDKYRKKRKVKKVKFTLEQGIKDPQGEYRYSSTLSLNSALDGGGCNISIKD